MGGFRDLVFTVAVMYMLMLDGGIRVWGGDVEKGIHSLCLKLFCVSNFAGIRNLESGLLGEWVTGRASDNLSKQPSSWTGFGEHF